MALKKDVELIFRGEDRASPTIKGVRENVRGLSEAITEQVAAAERGEGSINDLAKVYKQLQAAQGDVGDLVKLAAAYERLTSEHEKAVVKAEELRAAEVKLSAEFDAAEKKTKRLTQSRDGAVKKADAAEAAERELAASVTAAGEAFEAAGGDIRNFEKSQDAIRTAALETARALKQAADAQDNYADAAARGAAAKAAAERIRFDESEPDRFREALFDSDLPMKQAEEIAAQENRMEALTAAIQRARVEREKFNAAANESGLPQAQIEYISQLENRLEALNAAVKENEASTKAMNAERERIESSNEAQRIREAAAAYQEAANAADRLRVATEFKNQASGIAASARDIDRFGAAADTGATSARRLADTIQQISAPAQGASRTLDGINSVVAKAEKVFDGTKRRMSEYNAELNDLAAAQAGMASIARSIDDFSDQEVAVERATNAMKQAQTEVLQLASAIQQAENPTQEMANELVRAEAALERTGGAVQRETAKLKQLEATLEAAGVDTRNLAVAQTTLEASATRAAAAQTRLRNVSRGTGGFMGLNPNELQNLGFQVNDIIVSIASGQNPLTVFIQQGAQIGQIWPGAFSKIAARLPIIAAILAVVVPLGAAMGEAANDAQRLADATGNINSMGAAVSGLDPEKLATLAERLREIGVEAKDVNGIMRDLMADGLDTAQMDQYIDTAKDAAKVTGVDFAEALGTVREAFQGGMEDVYALQEATGVYNDAELEIIQTLFERGQAEEARATALEIYSNKMGQAAANSDGPWKRAINNLGDAWNRFVNWLSNTAPIRIAGDMIAWLGRQADYVTARLAGKSAEEARAQSEGRREAAPRHVRLGDPNRTTVAGRQALEDQERELEIARAVTDVDKRRLAVREAINSAIAAGATNAEAERVGGLAGQTFDAQQAQRDARSGRTAANRAEAEARRRQRAAETLARQIASLEEQLLRQLEQLDAAVANKQEDNLERRLSAIDSQYARLFRQIDEYAERTGGRGLIGDRTIEQARQHVEAQQQQLRNYETMEFRERELQNLLTERSEKLDAIDDRVARGLITPEQGLQEADIVINDIANRVTSMATNAIAFAEALRGAVPSPQLDAFIAQMNAALQNNSGGQNLRMSTDRRTDAISAAETQLNGIIAQRNQLIEHENYLVELGLRSRTDAQRNIEGYYDRTRMLISAQVQAILDMAAAFRDHADPAMRLFYDNLAARMNAIVIQTEPVDAKFQQLKGSIDQLLTTNIVGFIDTVAQAFAGLLTGQGDIIDFFGNIAEAFAMMIAKTLQGIAMLIIQVMILEAIDKMTGGLVKGLLKLYGSVMHSGGVVGSAGGRGREVSPLAFAGAPTYHTGGIAGFAPNEVPAILKRGEEVLTESDPRHRMNGGLHAGGSGGESKTQRAVLAVGDEEIANAMMGRAGEDVVMFHLRRNRATIKQEIGS